MFASRSTAVKKAVKRVKATALDGTFAKHQMHWKWPKRPEPKRTDQELDEELDDDISPDDEDEELDFIAQDRNLSLQSGAFVGNTDVMSKSTRSDGQGRRLRNIALQLASSPESDDDEMAFPAAPLSSRPVQRQASEESLVEELDIQTSTKKPPRFPRSPTLARDQRKLFVDDSLDEGPRSPDHSPPPEHVSLPVSTSRSNDCSARSPASITSRFNDCSAPSLEMLALSSMHLSL